MSQVAHPKVTFHPSLRAVWLGLLALLAAAAVVLVFVLSGSEDSQGVSASRSAPAVSEFAPARSGSDESRVAAAVGSAYSGERNNPDESRTAAAISGD